MELRNMDLRFGEIADIYYELRGTKPPKQADLVDTWFPGLVLFEDPSDGATKKNAYYADHEYMIHAVRYHGTFYTGESARVSQILGRLVGTAAGNREKERKSAELIRKHVAECFIKDMTLTPRLKEHTAELLSDLSDDRPDRMYRTLFDLVYELAAERRAKSDYERKTEPFAMDDESFDGIIYNAAYQLNLASYSGLCNAWLWLLTGSFLRNEAGRVLRLYDSSFIAVRRQVSETGDLEDKLNSLFYPETYEYTFDGDEEDLKNRFPDVEWYCDRCGAHLNEQEGFDDHLPEWKCTACGFVNRLDISEIYENDEDWRNRIRSADEEKFADAVRRRRLELEQKRTQEQTLPGRDQKSGSSKKTIPGM